MEKKFTLKKLAGYIKLSLCGVFLLSLVGNMSAQTIVACGDAFVDSGGTAAEYSSNENIEYSICPTNAGDVVSVTFNTFSTENSGTTSCFDGLTIHNGTDATAPTINPTTGTEWCWDLTDPTPIGTGNLNGMTITSTDASGCLFMVWNSDSSATRDGWDATVSCGAAPTCITPTALASANITDATADISFDVTSAGTYTIEYGPAPLTAGTGLTVSGAANAGTNTATLTGLTAETDYEYLVSLDCGGGDVSGTANGTGFTTGAAPLPPLTCGDAFLDTGGADADYSTNEDIEYSICPQIAGEVVTVTFTAFQTEANFDDMTIYDGADATATELGVFDGTNSPGTITSTDASGCLFILWSSDGSVTNPGWEATVSCAPPPTCPTPTALATNNVSFSSADIAFDATTGGTYTIEYGPAPLTAGTGQTVSGTAIAGANSVGISGLTAETDYEYLVTIDCGADGVSAAAAGAFTTINAPLTCGDAFLDTGGTAADYGTNESIEYSICPQNAGEVVVLTFTVFDTEANFDDMTIFDGADATATELGVFDGTNSPGTVTSTDASGCLFILWSSDGSVTSLGWEATVACMAAPNCAAASALASANITYNAADISFNHNAGGTYTIEYGPAPLTAGTGQTVSGPADAGANTVNLPGLDAETDYDYIVTIDCGVDGVSDAVAGTFTTGTAPTAVACGTNFLDTGGVDGDYGINERTDFLICPDNPGDVVTLDINFFATEAGFDGMNIYEGVDETGFLLGGLTGTLVNPISLTSTDPTGCIFIQWISDGSITDGGWDIDVICAVPESCPAPTAGTLNPTSNSLDVSFNYATAGQGYSIDDGFGNITTGTTVVGPNTVTVSGLTSCTDYTLTLTIDCGVDGLSTPVEATGTTAVGDPVCGGSFFDSGCTAANYQNNEDLSYTICPDIAGDVVILNFTFVDVESGFDFLGVFDGSDTTTPLNDDVQGAEQFISTAADGCLTVTFTSDGSVSNPGWEATVTCGPTPTCLDPTGLTASNIAIGGADVSFDYDDAGFDYSIEYGAAPLVAGAGTTVTGTTVAGANTASLTGLASCTDIEYIVTVDCGGLNGLSNPILGAFTSASPAPVCGGQFIDSGCNNEYPNSAGELYTICPDNAGDLVSVEFLSFSTENNGNTDCWDGLTIYDGNSVAATTIDPPNGGNVWCWDLTDTPAAGTGDLNGMTITSSDASGCLTFVFNSDGSVTRDGWDAIVTCNTPPPCEITCPADMSFHLGGGECTATVSYDLPTLTGFCATELVQTAGLPSGSDFPIGTTTNTFETTDIAGAIISCSFDVEVTGNTDVTTNITCNNSINLSVSADCQTTINADMILEGGPYACYESYSITLDYPEGTTVYSPANQIDGTHVDAGPIQVTVTGPNGETCWGNLIVEDKIGPEVICDENMTVFCTALNDGELPTPSYPSDYPDVNEGCCTLTPDNFTYVDGAAGGTTLTGFVGLFAPDTWEELISDPSGSATFSPDGTSLSIISPNPNILFGPEQFTQLAHTFQFNGTVSFDWDFINNDETFEVFVSLIAAEDGSVTTIVNTDLNESGSEAIAVQAGDILAFQAISTDGLSPEAEVIISNFSFFLNNDTPTDGDCISAIKRSWTVTDCSGNSSTCEQVIVITSPTLDDVDFPEDITLECGASTDPEDLPNADDYPNVNGDDIDLSNCNLGAVISEQEIDICAGSKKILREWTVIDWCSGDTRTETQIIKVEDSRAPLLTCPEDMTVSTNYYDCLATVSLPDPLQLSDVCSSATYSVTSVTGGTLVQVGSAYQIHDLPLGGPYFITYEANDGCGNTAECTMQVTVEDQVPPLAICDQFTNVGLGDDGTGRVFAASFDDGSYDNCGDVYFKVRRMDIGGCNNLNGDDSNAPDYQEWFDDSADFCCDDIANNNIMMIFRVFDVDPGEGPVDPARIEEGGDLYKHYNDCMVEVEVEDKLPPEITCPPDITISCLYEFDPNDLSVFGTIELDEADRDEITIVDPNGLGTTTWGIDGYATDNCSVTITENSNMNVECGEGQITRVFTATDAGGRTTSCIQRIRIINYDPFDENDINWPVEETSADCSDGLDPDSVPSPTIDVDICDNVFVGHDDLILPEDAPHCYKILRTWTVVDWCQYVPNSGSDLGRWEYTQVIKVTDSTPPVLTCDVPTEPGCSYDEDCGPGFITLTASATDDCSEENLYYTYQIDAFQDGTIDAQGVSNDASGSYPIGLHTITFTATDGCGNVSECSYDFEIEDCKAPTPVCQLIASSLMPSSGTLTIWAEDFEADGSSFDNCTDFEDLQFRIRKTDQFAPANNTPPSSSSTTVSYDCTELGTQWVDFWVGDENNNWDHCRTYIVIQDPTNACGNAEMAIIAGRISNENDEEIEEVEVQIAGGLGTGFVPLVTSLSGAYEWDDVPMHDDYTVTPHKDINHLNGVSTYDIVLISKHILGIESLDSPYKLIAADVNRSNSVSALDMVELRRLILHIDTEFQSNTSWRFVDKSFIFVDENNPFATSFPEVISLTDLDTDQMTADFLGVKVGDVNESALTNNLTGSNYRHKVGDLAFLAKDQDLKAGEEYTIEFNAQDAILGYQFTLGFDQTALEFVDVASANADNFGLSLLNEGVITASWNNSEAIKSTFSLTFKATADVTLSDALTINSRYTVAEAYDANADLLDVSLEFNTENGVVTTNNFELYQNTPNPFKEETKVSFNLPEASAATLTIFDVSGKVLKQYAGDFAKGYNEIIINKDQLEGAGILYYQLDTNTETSTKKMILID